MRFLRNENAHFDTELPFFVTIVRPERMKDAIELRAQAYGRHNPTLGESMRRADPADEDGSTVTLGAFSKQTLRLEASVRLHFNATAPLPVESSLALPGYFNDCFLMEPTRLCTKPSQANTRQEAALPVRLLFKSVFVIAHEAGVQHIVAGARPPLDRLYEDIQFSDIGGQKAFHPLHHASMIPHRVMSLPVNYHQPSHPWFGDDGLFGQRVLAPHADLDFKEFYRIADEFGEQFKANRGLVLERLAA